MIQAFITIRLDSCNALYYSSFNELYVTPSVGIRRAWARQHCRKSPSCFLAECRMRRLNQGSFVFLYFASFAYSDLYVVGVFSCTVLFVSISQVIGCENCLLNDLDCDGWGVKHYSVGTECRCQVANWHSSISCGRISSYRYFAS